VGIRIDTTGIQVGDEASVLLDTGQNLRVTVTAADAGRLGGALVDALKRAG
jgi:hypothetical protein